MAEKEFYGHVGKTLKYSLMVLVVALVIVFLGQESLVLRGFAVGLAVAVINTFFLALRIDKMVQIALLNQGRANMFALMGFNSRWVLMILACLLAVQTGWFDLLGMLAGFLVPYVLSVVEGIRGLVTLSGERTERT